MQSSSVSCCLDPSVADGVINKEAYVRGNAGVDVIYAARGQIPAGLQRSPELRLMSCHRAQPVVSYLSETSYPGQSISLDTVRFGLVQESVVCHLVKEVAEFHNYGIDLDLSMLAFVELLHQLEELGLTRKTIP